MKFVSSPSSALRRENDRGGNNYQLLLLPGEPQSREDVRVHRAAAAVDELDKPVAVGVPGDHVGGENILQQVLPLLRLQLEVERVADSDGGGGAALVLDQQPHPAVQGVLGGQVFYGYRLARPGEDTAQLVIALDLILIISWPTEI